MICRIKFAPLILVLGLITGSAHAALQGRDLNGSPNSFEAYYDTDLDITWLADANVNGPMTWADANTWAVNLSVVDTFNHLTYDNWRLPTALNQDLTGPCFGFNCASSEMGHLFYSELGGVAGQFIMNSSDPDLAKFTNLLAEGYWSGTEYTPDTSNAWLFSFHYSDQVVDAKYSGFYAIAVSPGDVAAVPEAQTYALMLAGLGLIRWRARRRG